VKRPPADFGEYYAGNPPDARLAPVLTYPQWLAKRRRRERLMRYAGALAGIVLPCLVAWVVVKMLVGP
jgi:hypothetical protein